MLRLNRVCQRWQRVLREVHCATLDIRFAKAVVNDPLLASVMDRFAGFRSLRLSGCIRITPTGTCVISHLRHAHVIF